MPQLNAYHRPNSLADALQLLAQPDAKTAVIAGGTHSVPHLDELVEEVVDLQAVGLDEISLTEDRLEIGAMVRLQTLIETEHIPTLIRATAQREGPNTLRHAATLGGVVVATDWESELLASLLVFEAQVTIQSATGTQIMALADFLADVPANLNDGLLTCVSIATEGQTASDRVARTPADKPIVAVLGRRDKAGQIHLACCGVAAPPILVSLDQISALNPPADFRGSSDYRRQMAITLAERVSTALKK